MAAWKLDRLVEESHAGGGVIVPVKMTAKSSPFNEPP